MIIRLPKKFTYIDKNACGRAYVKRGILYIDGNVNFKNLMYKLTYALKGSNRCAYCGAILTKKNRTIDHMYPQALGGPSITDNLLPCCKKCNLDKRGMTYTQFQEWRKTEENKKEAFFRKCIKENYEVTKRGRFLVKHGWITKINVKELLENVNLKKISECKYRKAESYFILFKQYQRPIIVSGNGWLLEGKCNLKHAKRHGKQRLCAIVLDNVVVKKNSP